MQRSPTKEFKKVFQFIADIFLAETIFSAILSQQTLTCSKSTIQTIEKVVKFVQT